MSRTVWIGAGGLAIVLVFGALWHLSPKAADGNGAGTLIAQDSGTLGQALVGSLSEEDSDGDGLRDWEEGLWGTNPNLADTDGDGTSDGAEVDTNRNPTVPGPDDALETEALKQNTSSEENEDLNTTDKFAQAFFADYLTLRKSGQISTDSGKAALVSQAAQLQTGQFTQNIYTRDDLTISMADDEAALRQYANIMGSIIEQYSINNRNEAVILLDALQSGNNDILNELTPIENTYRNMHIAMKGVSVPKTLARTHLSLMNSTIRLEATIGAMRDINTDPLSAVTAVSTYQNTAGMLFSALYTANQFYSEKGITFDKTEPGYIFVHMGILN